MADIPDYLPPSYWYGLGPSYKIAANAAFRTLYPEYNFPGAYQRAVPNANSTPGVLSTYDIVPIDDHVIDKQVLLSDAEYYRNNPDAGSNGIAGPAGYTPPGGIGDDPVAFENALETAKRLNAQHRENSEAFHAHDDVTGILNNTDNWNQAFGFLQDNVLTDDRLKESQQYRQALSTVAKTGGLNSPSHRELQSLLPSTAAQGTYDDYFQQLSNYYKQNRDDDFNYFAQDLNNEINSAPLARSPSEQHFLPFYSEEATRRESQNLNESIQFADNLDVGGVFKDFLKRLNKTQANTAIKGAQGNAAGQTAYTGDLGSASGVYQYLPSEELANQFNNASKSYKGTT